MTISEQETDEFANLPVSEKILISHGPVMVYSTYKGLIVPDLGKKFEGGKVKINTKSQPYVMKEDDNACLVEEMEITDLPVDSSAVANIFLADMSSFGETVEMHTNSNMTIYAERVWQVVLKTGSRLILNRG
uniref:Uncharacterized protein n=1 Tax=Caenorhabditis japonica TaxID=281687 RepID=A0A8R1IR25_CAEJA